MYTPASVYKRGFFGFLLAAFMLVFQQGAVAIPAGDSLAAANENSGTDTTHLKFDPAEMIQHHVSDAHELHLGGDISIYLPVIVKTDDGWSIFSSSHFYHNEHEITYVDAKGVKLNAEYGQYKNLVLFNEHIYYSNQSEPAVNLGEKGEVLNAAPFDMSITRNVLGILITALLMILLFTSVARAYKRKPNSAPHGLQSFMEPLIIFIRDEIVIPSIGKKKANRYMPFLLTIFFFIWIANMMGMLPFFGFNLTGTISITIVLAFIVFVMTVVSGNKYYWGHVFWPPGVPHLIKIILVPIEFAQVFIRPTVLMIRLTANILAGHIMFLGFVALILIFGATSQIAGYGVGFGATLFMIFMFFIELLVAFLQAYVFTLLTAMYFGDATQDPHH